MKPSPSQTKTGPAGGAPAGLMPGPDVSESNCHVCGKKIEDGHWFCRMAGGPARIVLCSPWCALSHFSQLQHENQ